MTACGFFDDPESLDEIFSKATAAFESRYNGVKPETAAFAPGRVNIIGEHTDYNDGFVLPMAIEMGTVAIGRLDFTSSGCEPILDSLPILDIELSTVVPGKVADDLGQLFFTKTFKATSLSPKAATDKDGFPSGSIWDPSMEPIDKPHWVNYVLGVIAAFSEQLISRAVEKKAATISVRVAFAASVPIGAGLSSSASLQVATFILMNGLLGKKISSESPASELVSAAEKCLWVEQTFAKLPCGIMDQMISFVGKSEAAILLDCRPLSVFTSPPFSYVSLPSKERVSFVIGETGVCHELASSEYALRRQQCERAARILGVKSLRECGTKWPPSADSEHLFRATNDDLALKRARHVVSENGRCAETANLFNQFNKIDDDDEVLRLIGKLMTESHRSLAKDFEVSCEELDTLVDAALSSPGVYGSRMTGGGFGGCTVTLVKAGDAKQLADRLRKAGAQRVFLVNASDGAKLII